MARLRRIRSFWLALAILAAGDVTFGKPLLAQATSSTPKESPARGQVEQLARQAGAGVSVAFRSLDQSQELFLEQNAEFPATPAVIQVPIMMELYAQAGAGELNPTDMITIHRQFTIDLPGALDDLDPKTDPDPELYKSDGKTMTLRDLCEHMVARNSSLAADLLIEKLGVERIRRRLDAMSHPGVRLNRTIGSRDARDPNQDNSATARGVFDMLWSLAKGQEAGDKASTEMIGMMARTALSQPSANGMPTDPRTAQSLRLSGMYENSMIVFGPQSYVVVIVVRGMTSAEARTELAAQIEHALVAALAPAL